MELATVILLSKAVNELFNRHYSIAFHAIVGIVIAATVMIIPFESFLVSFGGFAGNVICLAVGLWISFRLDRFNQKFVV